jgi:SAM-dependent methyltransferase
MSLPKPWNSIHRHGMLPSADHDERVRFDVIAGLNHFMSQHLAPEVTRAWRNRVRPAWLAREGRAPRDRHEVHAAMRRTPEWQLWSLVRRHTMEMRQHAGRELVGRQADTLRARAERLNAGCETLQLNPELPIPRYVSAVDTHLMRGGYTGATLSGDVSNAANYDAGMYATTGGSAGPQNDAAGRALVAWLRAHHPQLSPRRIIDLGCGLGHNSVPVYRAYPNAEIIAVDVAEPMLRYGHARARALGCERLRFVQADATDTGLDSGSADLVFTTMVLHETSRDALPKIFAEARRLLRAGGLTVHLEQPPYHGLDPFEQFMRDWDGRYNNEPFWSALNEMRLPELLHSAGFLPSLIVESKAQPPSESTGEGLAAEQENFGRAPSWYVVAAQVSP